MLVALDLIFCEDLLEVFHTRAGFCWVATAQHLRVSERTLGRRGHEFRFASVADIVNGSLDEMVKKFCK